MYLAVPITLEGSMKKVVGHVYNVTCMIRHNIAQQKDKEIQSQRQARQFLHHSASNDHIDCRNCFPGSLMIQW